MTQPADTAPADDLRPAPEAGSPADAAPAATGTPASHDSGVPDALRAFLLTGWRPFDPAAPAPVAHADAFYARRRALSALFPGERLIIPTGHEKTRSNDTTFRFRPGSDFAWLTGNHEPDCVLVLEPLPAGHRDLLFVEPVSRDDISFFTDRNKGELWVGRRLGVPHSAARFAVHDACPLAALYAHVGPKPVRPLRKLRAASPAPVQRRKVVFGSALTRSAVPALHRRGGTHGPKSRLLRGFCDDLDRLLPADEAQLADDKALAAALAELRLCKDAAEVEALTDVIASTKRGFEDVIRALPRLRSEREVEVTFYGRARTEGNDVGYGTIAAAGCNACILHWTRNDAPLRPGELLLLDAGVEGHTLYTADITRTLPISGAFSPAQREIYDLVYAAQRAAIAEVRPGNDFMYPNRVAMRVLAEGLERLGILPDAATALIDTNQFYRRYSLHNISHMLGIDVHDCAKARQETYRFGKLRPGMVLTVEPGLYFQPDDLTVPERYRGIGVRIEDDILVTEDGCLNLSADIPAEAEAVERWVREVQS